MVAWMESITKAAKAVRRVAALVIHCCHHASADGCEEEEELPVVRAPFIEPLRVAVVLLPLGGDSKAARPIRELPRRISVRVVAWWMCALSCRGRVEYIFSKISSRSKAWKTQSLAGGRKSASMKISHLRCHERKLDNSEQF